MDSGGPGEGKVQKKSSRGGMQREEEGAEGVRGINILTECYA